MLVLHIATNLEQSECSPKYAENRAYRALEINVSMCQWERISVAFKSGLGLEKNSQQHKDNSLKLLKTANPKSPRPYIREGLLLGSFSPRGLIFVLFLLIFFFFVVGDWGGGGGEGQGLILGILRHVIFNEKSFRLLGIRVKTPGAHFSKFPKSSKAITKIF